VATGDLITNEYAQQNSTLSALQTSNPVALASIISAASQAIRTACMRDFGSNTYTEYKSGGGYPNQYLSLDQYPVTEITRVAAHPLPVLNIRNSSSVNQRATVATTSAGLVLATVASAVTVAATLTFTSYPTLAAIAEAVNDLGNGWTAVVMSNYSQWPSADLRPLQGAVTAINTAAQIELFTEDLTHVPAGDSYGNLPEQGWRLDPESAELFGYFPEGKLNIRIDYTAGADAVPADIQRGCLRLCALMYEDERRDSAVTETQLGPYTTVFKRQAESLIKNPAVWDFISPYRDLSKLV
jgi:hypothetical protein